MSPQVTTTLDVCATVKGGTVRARVDVVPKRRSGSIDANWLRIDPYEGWLIQELKAEKAEPKWFSEFCKVRDVARLFKAAEGIQARLNALKRADPDDPDLSRITVAELQGIVTWSPTNVGDLQRVKDAAGGLSVSGDDTERRAVLVRGIEVAIGMWEAYIRLSRAELLRRGE